MAPRMGRQELFDHESRHPPLPGHKEHSCTDVIWLAVLLVALCGLGLIDFYVYRNGNVQKLTHSFNYEGKLCGAGGRGDYTYWCLGPDLKLDFHHPICVESCPKDSDMYTECFDPDMNHTTLVASYPTKYVAHFCLPEKVDVASHLLQKLPGDYDMLEFTQVLDAIWDARMLIASSGVLAICLGYLYLFLLDNFASPMVKAGLVFLIIGPLGFGSYFMYCAFFLKEDDTLALTRDIQWNIIFGGSCYVLSAVSTIVACYFGSSLDTAIGCIEASCECLFQEATLLLEPFISLTLKVLTMMLMGMTIFGLISCGKVHMSGQGGIGRSFEFTTGQKICLGYAVFMTSWLLELGTATSQYVLAWATQMWYFTPYVDGRKLGVPACTVCKGYVNVLAYHMGTMAFGSVLIALLRCLRIVMYLVARAAEAKGNVVCACIGKVCMCCLSCTKNFLSVVNKNAYMDVAITSEGFCRAAPRALGVMMEEIPAVSILNGAHAVFTLVGLGVISGIPGALTFLACKKLEVFSNPDSSHYIAQAQWVALASVAVSAVIAVCFMVVFDTVGDAILYCFVIQERRVIALAGCPVLSGYSGYSSEVSSETQEESEGFLDWLFGTGKDAVVLNETRGGFQEHRVQYAPPRLQQLIEDHARLAK